MAKAIVDSLDDVTEALHDEYSLIEDDKSPLNGRYRLNVDTVDGYELTNPTPLKTALSRERGTAAELQKKVAAFGEIDPADALSALEKVKTFESFDPEKEADRIAKEKFDNLEKQLTAQHSKKLEALDGSLVKTKAALNKALIETAARAAIAEAGGDVELLLPHVTRSAKLKEQDDGYVVEIVDEKGFARIGHDGADHMDMAGLVGEMKESKIYGKAFDAPDTSGTGTPPDSSSRKAPAGVTKMSNYDLDATPKEKAAFLKQKRKSRGR